MVLADDLDNNGHMELVAATMNGNVYAFQTAAEYDPLRSWTAAVSDVGACHLCHRWTQWGIMVEHIVSLCAQPARATGYACFAYHVSSGSISSQALVS